ncbi:MAG: hypothetical protein L0H96_12855 [Humibacillus sp.]|nr:hypothetical protein [Humibacillus sp.]MDN5777795.1 hypothetical protein [Humibacillus sp.]
MQGVGPGSVLGGRYTVTLRTSEGVHHERWRASDHTLEREVVLVCFTAGSSVAAAALDAARRAAGVEDPRLVRVLDVGSDQGVGFIVEEPLTGAATMADLLGSGGLPAEEVRRLVGEAASALDKARQRGLHHLALTPGAVLRMADGAVKVRGIATDAALLDADSVTGEQASRLDAVGLVKLIYAGLTARWPAGTTSTQAASSPAGSAGSVGSTDELEGLATATAVSFASLDAAPTIVGGVAPPSEIAVGVPNDLDLICRMTLNDDRGPLSPGDLALQIAPWAATAPTNDGGSGIGLTPTRAKATPHRQLPTLPRRRRSAASSAAAGAAAGAGAGARAASTAGDQTGTDETPPAAATAKAGAGDTTAGSAPAETATDGPDVAGLEGTEPNDDGPNKNIAAAGAAMAGVAGAAGAIGDRVGSFARAAADKASAKAAERRAAHALDDEEVEDIHLDEALDEAPVGPLEPPIPGFTRMSSAGPSKAGSRMALAIIGVLVVVLLVIGINNVMKIGQSDPAAAPVVRVTVTRPPTPSATTPTPSTTAPTTTTAPAAPVTITGGSVLDPGGVEKSGKVKLAYDGNPATAWTSRWYGTPTYNGKKDGIGIVLDLDRSVVLTGVDLVLPAKQDVTVYAATTASITGAQKIGSVTNKDGTITMKAPAGLTTATKLIVWVTKAAPAEAPNHYRAQVSEVSVR